MALTEAPNFRDEYPLAGERIGPAWRAIWALMADGQWHIGIEIARDHAAEWNLAERTVRNLIDSAVKAGLLERQLTRMQWPRRGRGASKFRRIDLVTGA